MSGAEKNENEKKAPKSFWETVPGILTGIAAIITAVGGCIAVLISLPRPNVLFPVTDTPVVSTPPVTSDNPNPTKEIPTDVPVMPAGTREAQTLRPTITPFPCTPSGNSDTVEVLKIDSPTGTPLKIGQTYTFIVTVKYQLATRDKALLEQSIYSFKDGSGIGRAGDNSVEVAKGCEIRDIVLVNKIPDHSQNEMRLATVLRVDEYTLLFDWGFTEPYPTSR